MKKAIFFDIDGTLIDCANGIKEMTPAVQKSIKLLQAEGNYAFIASGRPYAFLDKNILDFGFDGFVLVNGAQVIINNKTIYDNPIEKDVVLNIINNFEKLDIEYILEGKHYSYMKDKFKNLNKFQDIYNIPRSLILNEYDINNIDVHKIEMLAKTNEASDYCFNLENDYFNLIHYDHSEKYNSEAFELYPNKNSKASGILKVLEYLDIDIKDSYAFGDGKNDIEMLSTVGMGIAMGNASDFVKSHANKVTTSVLNDGIANGIEKYINNFVNC